ncbi:unnamed protein product [Phytophthora lilii]|uniref:Unnamed protein product n=1 Tax=Phytophthora lilii TaxID=2077276 RepID=A0A9W6TVY8_9STRA|nr:unnamed protein product [Phytophthora lilii]
MREEEAKKKQIAAASPKSPEEPAPSSPTSQTSVQSPKSPLPTGPASPVASAMPTKAEIRQRITSGALKPVQTARQAPVFASQNEELEFTEDEDRRFRVENVMLHRHFQENLEDAKWVASQGQWKLSNLSDVASA